MAPKKSSSRLVENPPSASPSQDQLEEESEEEETQSEEEEETDNPSQKSHIKSPDHSQKLKPASSSEEEEEEEEDDNDDGEGERSDADDDSDDNTKSSPNASDFHIKPIADSAKNQPQQKKGLPKEPAKSTSKRVLEVQKDSPKKRSKVVKEDGEKTRRVVGSNSGGASAGRVWSEEDEIVVLKSMIDYKNQKGLDPQGDMSAFYEFMKGKGRFRFDVTKTQLYEKVRRLKKKFFNHVERVGENGQDPVFAKPHESQCFEISKMIWGPSKGEGNGVSHGFAENAKDREGKVKRSGKVKSIGIKSKEDDKKKRVVQEADDSEKTIVEKSDVKEIGEKPIVGKSDMKINGDEMITGNGIVEKDELVNGDDEGDFLVKYPFLTESLNLEYFLPAERSHSNFFKKNISLIGNEKARELEEKWKKLRILEIECFYERTKLMIEQVKLMMEARQKR